MGLEVQGGDVIIQVREVGDTDWKTMTCEIDNQAQLTNDVTEVDTKCGTFNGVKSAKLTISGNAVYNVDPEADEVTYNDVANWQINKTLLEILQKNLAFTASDGTDIADGAKMHTFASGRFVDSTFQAPVGDVGKFSWTFKGTGVPVFGGASA